MVLRLNSLHSLASLESTPWSIAPPLGILRRASSPNFECVLPLSSATAILTADARPTKGDVQATSQKLSETTAALDSYRLATLIDPTNFEARLNSAAVRLQLADHDLQSMQ